MYYIVSLVADSEGLYFAYSGAGFVLLLGLMKRLAENLNGESSLSVKYQDRVKTDCYGDAVLSYTIFNKTSVKLEELYLTFASNDLGSFKINRER